MEQEREDEGMVVPPIPSSSDFGKDPEVCHTHAVEAFESDISGQFQI